MHDFLKGSEMTSTEYAIFIAACIIGVVLVVCLIVAIVTLPSRIRSERERKQREFLNKKDSYSFNPLGLTTDSMRHLRHCLADALKACQEGNLREVTYHVQNAWTVMPSEGFGPVGPSVKAMKLKERWKEFCRMLKLASKLPQDENPQELMEKWLKGAILLCDSRIKRADDKE